MRGKVLLDPGGATGRSREAWVAGGREETHTGEDSLLSSSPEEPANW